MFKRTVRSALLGMTLGAVVVGTTTLTAAAASPASDVTLTVMASQEWIKPAEQELGKKFEAADRHPRRLPDHPGRPVLQRPEDEAQRRRGGRHLRRPERQVRSQAPVRRREERGRPDGRGVDDPDRPGCPRPVQPERQGLRRGDLGHHRVQLLRDGLQQGHLPAARHQRPHDVRRVRGCMRDHQGRRHHPDLRADRRRLAPGALVPLRQARASSRQSPVWRTSSTPTRPPSPVTPT